MRHCPGQDCDFEAQAILLPVTPTGQSLRVGLRSAANRLTSARLPSSRVTRDASAIYSPISLLRALYARCALTLNAPTETSVRAAAASGLIDPPTSASRRPRADRAVAWRGVSQVPERSVRRIRQSFGQLRNELFPGSTRPTPTRMVGGDIAGNREDPRLKRASDVVEQRAARVGVTSLQPLHELCSQGVRALGAHCHPTLSFSGPGQRLLWPNDWNSRFGAFSAVTSCAKSAAHAHYFNQLSSNCKQRRTRWRMTQSGANRSLVNSSTG